MELQEPENKSRPRGNTLGQTVFFYIKVGKMFVRGLLSTEFIMKNTVV